MTKKFGEWERVLRSSKAVRRYLAVIAAMALFGLSGCDFGSDDEAGLATRDQEAHVGDEAAHDGHDDEEGHEDDHNALGEEHDDHDGESEDHDDVYDDHDGEGEGHDDALDVHDDEDGHEAVVALTPAQILELRITTQAVDVGPVAGEIILPAEIRFSGNSVAHITPRVTGMVAEVFANEGDIVQVGDPLAVLDSRELAEAAAAYLSAVERLELAAADVARSRQLRERGVVSEQAYFDDRQTHATTEIEVRAASQSLLALGLDADAIAHLSSDETANLTRYQLVAPISGTVIERHAVLGEVIEVDDEEPSFVIADTSEVWVDIAIYPNVMDQVALGAIANVLDQESLPIASGNISFVAPHIDEQTRTGRARMVLSNDVVHLRPGMFVSVEVIPVDEEHRLRVPSRAVQSIGDETIVFVETEEGFEVREVDLGDASSTHVEVLDGLLPGEAVVIQGAFALKAEIMKGGFDDGHNH